MIPGMRNMPGLAVSCVFVATVVESFTPHGFDNRALPLASTLAAWAFFR